MFIGNVEANTFKLGVSDVDKIYLGTNEVWSNVPAVPVSNYATIVYEGNGSTQDIITSIKSDNIVWVSNEGWIVGQYTLYEFVIYECIVSHTVSPSTPNLDPINWLEVGEDTEIDFDGSMVWIKCIGTGFSHQMVDTLRGATKALNSDTTNPQATILSGVTSFNSNGISLGNDGQYNYLLQKYILWQWGYSKMIYGTTSGGKPYVSCYDLASGNASIMYQGNGIAGHEIPNPINTPAIMYLKNISSSFFWFTYDEFNTATDRMILSEKSLSTAIPTAFNNTEPTSSNITLGTSNEVNANNDNYILYSHNSSSTNYITSYTGTGSSGLNVSVPLDMTIEGARVMIKSSSTGAWNLYDNIRSQPNSTIDDVLQADNIAKQIDNSSNQRIEFENLRIRIHGTGMNVNTVGVEYILYATIPAVLT